MQITESPIKVERFLKTYPIRTKNAFFFFFKMIKAFANPDSELNSAITTSHVLVEDAKPIQMTVSHVDNGVRSLAYSPMIAAKSLDKKNFGFIQEVDLLLEVTSENLDLAASLVSDIAVGIILVKREDYLPGFYQLGSAIYPAELTSIETSIYGIKMTFNSLAHVPFYIYDGDTPSFENKPIYCGELITS